MYHFRRGSAHRDQVRSGSVIFTSVLDRFSFSTRLVSVWVTSSSLWTSTPWWDKRFSTARRARFAPFATIRLSGFPAFSTPTTSSPNGNHLPTSPKSPAAAATTAVHRRFLQHRRRSAAFERCDSLPEQCYCKWRRIGVRGCRAAGGGAARGRRPRA